ncbi:MAG: hypothetical protein ACR2J3_10870 [Aridibacter sp.]
MSKPNYEESVFINCPFDKEYHSLFEATIFTVHDCGFIARCASEVSDSSQVRIDKIFQIISDCKYGIHDISRTQLDKTNNLPRFNMPLELGMFLSAKRFGNSQQKQKLCLIVDTEKFRYQKFCSDIAGQDISAHNDNEDKLIKVVRDWLNDSISNIRIPSGSKMCERYHLFENDLPLYCQTFKKEKTELTFIDFRNLVIEWLKDNS